MLLSGHDQRNDVEETSLVAGIRPGHGPSTVDQLVDPGSTSLVVGRGSSTRFCRSGARGGSCNVDCVEPGKGAHIVSGTLHLDDVVDAVGPARRDGEIDETVYRRSRMVTLA
jgi:hypothetical protein